MSPRGLSNVIGYRFGNDFFLKSRNMDAATYLTPVKAQATKWITVWLPNARAGDTEKCWGNKQLQIDNASCGQC